MARPLAAVTLAAAVLVIQGCATGGTSYQWGDYDTVLYTQYKNPQDRQAYVASLKKIMLAADRSGSKVPPGIYAEYGYALFEEGNAKEAIAYFERERAAWPESRVFMDKMIANAGRRPPPSRPPPAAPASALEKGRS